MVFLKRVLFAGFVLIAAGRTAAAAPIERVSLSKSFFNPALGEKIVLSFEVRNAGDLSVKVIDRDGFQTRSLTDRSVLPGKINLDWDGRDDSGAVVPDEAWSFKIDLRTGKKTHSYFPAASTGATMTALKSDYYDRQSGVLSYNLERASRVHVQGGTGVAGQTSERGAVLKTIVNREPRPAGRVLEHWNGEDESATIFVPDLPNFILGIAVTPLPENSVITIGNRSKSFVESLTSRTGQSLLPHRGVSHAHHAGLSTLADISPSLRITPRAAEWSESQDQWVINSSEVTIDATIQGESAAAFLETPGRITIYLDGKAMHEVKSGEPTLPITVGVDNLKPGSHILAVNWHSPHGPVAANAFRFTTSTN